MSENKIPKRSEAELKDTWATEDIFPSDEAWEAALEAGKGLPDRLSTYKGRLGESGKTLLEYLSLSVTAGEELGRLYTYAHLKNDQDTSVGKYQEMRGKAMNLYVQTGTASSFDTPEIIAIPEETLASFYGEEPGLSLYKRHLDKMLKKKEHYLSDAEEKLLAAAGEMAETPENIASMFLNADIKFPDAEDEKGEKKTLTQSTYIPLMNSQDRTLRKSAYEALYGTFAGFKNTSAAFLDGQVKQQIYFTKSRKYDNTLERALSNTEVPAAVYENLIAAVNANMDKLHKYVNLRKKLLGYDELHMYDLYVPIVGEAEEKITYEQAKQNVFEALRPLGEGYLSVLREGFDSRWIDVYENEGKRNGAYSSGGARPHPFVLLNHKDTLDCQFTLAHEMGHALHSYFSVKSQPPVYSDYVIFVAEVASTCNEVLLMRNLLSKTEDKKKKAYLINHFLEQFRGTVYRQTMFAEFELLMNRHAEKGETLTADFLNDVYYKLNETYYGSGMELDKLIEAEWQRIPHFFYNFYVFQYATGFAAAVAIAERILAEGQPAVDDYMKFLSAGSTQDPVSLLKITGVDMTTAKPIDDALKLFDTLLDEMEALL